MGRCLCLDDFYDDSSIALPKTLRGYYLGRMYALLCSVLEHTFFGGRAHDWYDGRGVQRGGMASHLLGTTRAAVKGRFKTCDSAE
jgi:hypothetical protein